MATFTRGKANDITGAAFEPRLGEREAKVDESELIELARGCDNAVDNVLSVMPARLREAASELEEMRRTLSAAEERAEAAERERDTLIERWPDNNDIHRAIENFEGDEGEFGWEAHGDWKDGKREIREFTSRDEAVRFAAGLDTPERSESE